MLHAENVHCVLQTWYCLFIVSSVYLFIHPSLLFIYFVAISFLFISHELLEIWQSQHHPCTWKNTLARSRVPTSLCLSQPLYGPMPDDCARFSSFLKSLDGLNPVENSDKKYEMLQIVLLVYEFYTPFLFYGPRRCP